MDWEPLHLSGHIPADLTLLIKHDFDPVRGYTIHITDLTRVWTESLDKDAVVSRARSLATVIDPHEDKQQFELLLSHVKSALQKAPGTRLDLEEGKSKSALRLTIDYALPIPLRALNWSFELELLPGSALTTEVVLPLIRTLGFRNEQLGALKSLVKVKDTVIAKILDKMEATGTELSAVFPSGLGAKSSKTWWTRESAAKHVKGLEAFDEVKWSTAFVGDSSEQANKSDWLRGVFSTEKISKTTPSNVLKPADDAWWHRLLSLGSASFANEKKAPEFAQTGLLSQNAGQSTIKKETKSVSSATESTADEDESSFDTPEVPAPVLSRQARDDMSDPPKTVVAQTEGSSSRVRHRLGTIGGRKQEKSSSAAMSKVDEMNKLDSEQSVSVRSSAPIVNDEITRQDEQLTSISSTDAGLGSKHSSPENRDQLAKNTRADSPTAEPTPHSKLDLEQLSPNARERLADQKREELKRQLEAKSKTVTRKKRKF